MNLYNAGRIATGDVQSVRMFVDQVLMQSVIMVVSLTAYVVYMASLSPSLTVACLATTPVLWYRNGKGRVWASKSGGSPLLYFSA